MCDSVQTKLLELQPLEINPAELEECGSGGQSNAHSVLKGLRLFFCGIVNIGQGRQDVACGSYKLRGISGVQHYLMCNGGCEMKTQGRLTFLFFCQIPSHW